MQTAKSLEPFEPAIVPTDLALQSVDDAAPVEAPLDWPPPPEDLESIEVVSLDESGGLADQASAKPVARARGRTDADAQLARLNADAAIGFEALTIAHDPGGLARAVGQDWSSDVVPPALRIIEPAEDRANEASFRTIQFDRWSAAGTDSIEEQPLLFVAGDDAPEASGVDAADSASRSRRSRVVPMLGLAAAVAVAGAMWMLPAVRSAWTIGSQPDPPAQARVTPVTPVNQSPATAVPVPAGVDGEVSHEVSVPTPTPVPAPERVAVQSPPSPPSPAAPVAPESRTVAAPVQLPDTRLPVVDNRPPAVAGTAAAVPVVAPPPAPVVLPSDASRERPAAAAPLDIEPPASATPAVAASPSRDVEAEVRQALSSYREAYATLDADAARQIWPNVDQRSLARAFAGLKSQQLQFDRCEIDIRGSVATASCLGRTVFVQRVGRQQPQIEAGRWIFTLRQDANGWRIEQTEVRR